MQSQTCTVLKQITNASKWLHSPKEVQHWLCCCCPGSHKQQHKSRQQSHKFAHTISISTSFSAFQPANLFQDSMCTCCLGSSNLHCICISLQFSVYVTCVSPVHCCIFLCRCPAELSDIDISRPGLSGTALIPHMVACSNSQQQSKLLHINRHHK